MNAEEREKMYRLCGEIQLEKDHQKCVELLRELNDLIERKKRRLLRNEEQTPSESS